MSDDLMRRLAARGVDTTLITPREDGTFVAQFADDTRIEFGKAWIGTGWDWCQYGTPGELPIADWAPHEARLAEVLHSAEKA